MDVVNFLEDTRLEDEKKIIALRAALELNKIKLQEKEKEIERLDELLTISEESEEETKDYIETLKEDISDKVAEIEFYKDKLNLMQGAIMNAHKALEGKQE